MHLDLAETNAEYAESVDSDTYDPLDRQIVHALQVDGRAPFARIGDALGVSGQTIARRYTALRSAGAQRVVALTEPEALDETLWFTRVRCTPDAAGTLATALANRDDTAWVQLISGGTDIVFMARARAEDDGNALLLQKLPRTPRVLDVSAQCVLHVFLRGSHGVLGKATVLTAEQIRLLEPAEDTAPATFTETDQLLLTALSADGRAPLADLAEATGWSQTTVRRRMNGLLAGGVLRFDVDFDLRILGLRAQALLWLSVAPAELDAVGSALARHPEVAFAAATTGSTNLLISVVLPRLKDLYTYITRSVAVLPAVTQIESAPVVRRVKNAARPLYAGDPAGTRTR
jgi:DNA-binding Lrp family transcriptional regulator